MAVTFSGPDFLRSTDLCTGKESREGKERKRKTFFHPRRGILQRAWATRFTRCEASIYRRPRCRNERASFFNYRPRHTLYFVLAYISTSDGLRSLYKYMVCGLWSLHDYTCMHPATLCYIHLDACGRGACVEVSWLMVSVDGTHMRLTSCCQGDAVHTHTHISLRIDWYRGTAAQYT